MKKFLSLIACSLSLSVNATVVNLSWPAANDPPFAVYETTNLCTPASLWSVVAETSSFSTAVTSTSDCGFFGVRAHSDSIRLAWDPSPDQSVAGYRVYYWVDGSTITNVVDFGNSLSGKVTGLLVGVLYHFASTCYTTDHVESDFSNIILTPPGSPFIPGLQINLVQQ